MVAKYNAVALSLLTVVAVAGLAGCGSKHPPGA